MRTPDVLCDFTRHQLGKIQSIAETQKYFQDRGEEWHTKVREFNYVYKRMAEIYESDCIDENIYTNLFQLQKKFGRSNFPLISLDSIVQNTYPFKDNRSTLPLLTRVFRSLRNNLNQDQGWSYIHYLSHHERAADLLIKGYGLFHELGGEEGFGREVELCVKEVLAIDYSENFQLFPDVAGWMNVESTDYSSAVQNALIEWRNKNPSPMHNY